MFPGHQLNNHSSYQHGHAPSGSHTRLLPDESQLQFPTVHHLHNNHLKTSSSQPQNGGIPAGGSSPIRVAIPLKATRRKYGSSGGDDEGGGGGPDVEAGGDRVTKRWAKRSLEYLLCFFEIFVKSLENFPKRELIVPLYLL